MKTWYLDFDLTLFNTTKLKEALADSMSGLIHPQDFLASFEKILRGYEEGYNYSIASHALYLEETAGIPQDITTSNLMNVIFESRDFLYDDAIPFLNHLARQTQEIYLLSFGDFDFQKDRIEACGIEKYFKNIIITQDHKHIITLPTPVTNETYFLNDNPTENKQISQKYPQSNIIEIQREITTPTTFEIITSLSDLM